jgi:hypothetical protein
MGLNIKADSVEVSEVSFSNELLPKGKYCAVVHSIRDEDKIAGENAKSPGAAYSQLAIRFEICEGEFSGRSLWKNVIYEHATSQPAADIGLDFIKRLYLAGKCEGDITVENLEAAAPITIGVKVQPERNGYPARNEVSFTEARSSEDTVAAKNVGVTEW